MLVGPSETGCGTCVRGRPRHGGCAVVAPGTELDGNSTDRILNLLNSIWRTSICPTQNHHNARMVWLPVILGWEGEENVGGGINLLSCASLLRMGGGE
jgi:hypothetical protein